jgi:hypothetical protein
MSLVKRGLAGGAGWVPLIVPQGLRGAFSRHRPWLLQVPASQGPVHALSQQTLATQVLVPHSPGLHGWPRALAMQVWLALQIGRLAGQAAAVQQ